MCQSYTSRQSVDPPDRLIVTRAVATFDDLLSNKAYLSAYRMQVGRPPCRIPSAHTAPHVVLPGRQCRICMRKQCPARQPSPVKAQGLDYKQAGVDIDAGAELVRRIQQLNPSIGGFSGLVPFGGLLA